MMFYQFILGGFVLIAYTQFGKLAVQKGYDKSKWAGKGALMYIGVFFAMVLLIEGVIFLLAGERDLVHPMFDPFISQLAGVLVGGIASRLQYLKMKDLPDNSDLDDFGTKVNESNFEEK